MEEYMNPFKISLLAVVIAGAGLLSGVAVSAPAGTVYGQAYQPGMGVGKQQAQIIYFRAADVAGESAAHVYVDGEFQNALLTNSFTRFCVSPGEHSLGAYQNDAPNYKGKTLAPKMALSGGKTYFMQVGSAADGRPVEVSEAQAESVLKGLHQQVHLLSRASAVQSCQLQPEYKEYVLSGDVLFKFGKSMRHDMTPQGRQAVGKLIGQLHEEHVNLDSIEVIGHTDPIGRESSNYALGARRASTVREMLIDGGLPAANIQATSAGSSQPLVASCSGSRQAQAACYAPDRRVVVRVKTQH
jgi:OOP family OmpA-OmpF porin